MLHSSGYGLAAFRVAGALGHSFRFQQRDVASRAGQGARPISVNLRTCLIGNVWLLLGFGEVETPIWGLKLTLIGARPTRVSCCLSNYLSEAHTQLVRFRVKFALISVD